MYWRLVIIALQYHQFCTQAKGPMMFQIRRHQALIVGVVFGLLLIFNARSQAAGVVAVCDEASLDAALAGGGVVSFTCSGTITVMATKVVGANTIIDGAGQTVTISGGG